MPADPTTPTTPADPAATPPAAATGTTHYPAFVDQPTKVAPLQWKDQTVPMWDLQFLGLSTSAGVNAILCKKLIAANRNLYNLCKKQMGIDAAVDLTIEQYGAWCWYGMAPVYAHSEKFADVVTNKKTGEITSRTIQLHESLRGGNSLHTSGSAIDVNLWYNPFIAGRSRTGTCYGETHKMTDTVAAKVAGLSPDETAAFLASKQKPEKGQKAPVLDPAIAKKVNAAAIQYWNDNKWQPAVEIYDRAMNLFTGGTAQVYSAVSEKDARAKTSDDPPKYVHYDRFARVSHALVHYFGLVYGGDPTHAKPDRKTFADGFQAMVAMGLFPASAKDLDGRVLTYSMVYDKQAVCDKFYDKIIEDHDTIKLAFVNGSLTVNEDDLKVGFARTTQRDPCHGFLNIRPEVVTELACEQQLRWGVCLLGGQVDADGDVMHFDLGSHFAVTWPRGTSPVKVPALPWPDALNEDLGRTT